MKKLEVREFGWLAHDHQAIKWRKKFKSMSALFHHTSFLHAMLITSMSQKLCPVFHIYQYLIIETVTFPKHFLSWTECEFVNSNIFTIFTFQQKQTQNSNKVCQLSKHYSLVKMKGNNANKVDLIQYSNEL